MTIPEFLSHYFPKTSSNASIVDTLMFYSLHRNPAKVRVELLCYHPEQALFNFYFMKKHLSDDGHSKCLQNLNDHATALHGIAYRFIRRMLNPSVSFSAQDTDGTFYSPPVIDSDELSFLTSVRMEKLHCIFPLHEFEYGQHSNKYIIQLGWLALLIGIKVDDVIFVQLFGDLPKSILFAYYQTLLVESFAASAEYQARFSVYIDYFSSRLQGMEIEDCIKQSEDIGQTFRAGTTLADRADHSDNPSEWMDVSNVDFHTTLKTSALAKTKISVLDDPSSLDVVTSEPPPQHSSAHESSSVKSLETVALTTSPGKSEEKRKDKSDDFVSFQTLLSLPRGSRVDVLDEYGMWCNGEVVDTYTDCVIIGLLFWKKYPNIKISYFHNSEKVAYPGTMATDHFKNGRNFNERLRTFFVNYPGVLPNIIYDTPSLARVYEGELRHCFSQKERQHWASEVEHAPLGYNVHKQVDVFLDGDFVFHGCIEKVDFQNDVFYYVLGKNETTQVKYFIPLCRNSHSFQLPQGFEVKQPTCMALFTYRHQ